MSPHWCLSKEPLRLCSSKDSGYLGVVLCFPEFAPGDGPGSSTTIDVEIGENHSSWKRREVEGVSFQEEQHLWNAYTYKQPWKTAEPTSAELRTSYTFHNIES